MNRALRPQPAGEVLAEGFRLQIRRSDMDTLRGLNWLNDEVRTTGETQGTHGTGKTGKMDKKKSLSGKTQGIWLFCQNTGKTQGILFAQVVNSLDIAIFAAKISILFHKLDRSAKSVLCM